MDPISFAIPNKTSSSLSGSKTSSDLNQNYVKIAPNIYKFGDDPLLNNNVYVLYNNACELKKTNSMEAFKLFDKCRSLIDNTTKPEIAYEIYVNLGLLSSELNSSFDVIEGYYNNALQYCPERAEPYYYLSIYCQRKLNYEKSYELLNKARLLSYDVANTKYPTVQRNAYGKYVHDNLAVACYWLKKYDEAIELIECILNDPDFSDQRDKLNKNLVLNRDELTKDL